MAQARRHFICHCNKSCIAHCKCTGQMLRFFSLFFAFLLFLFHSLFSYSFMHVHYEHTQISQIIVWVCIYLLSLHFFFLTRHELAYATANFILKSIEEREKKTKWIKSRKHGDFMILISCYSPSYALFACAGLLCTHAILLWVPLNIKLLQWKLRFSVYFFHYSSSAM